ncbi:MAG TPA: GHMP kinase [Dehalococcoidia bacterium]|nr:GHMP kinase [Dehalococcoidia bacterium]
MIIAQTPLRLSFLGGGTDFEDFYKLNGGGAVLSSAIDKFTFVIVKERFDDMIYLNYSKKEITGCVDDVEHDLIREAMKMTGVEKGVEITTMADIPSEGTGLGSSSSITVGLLQALHTFRGVSVTAEDLARQACRIEIDILGKPIGKQDQYISSYGNMRFISFRPDDIRMDKLGISQECKRKLNENLLLFYTGRTRKSSDILTEQKANIIERQHLLKELARLAHKAKLALLDGAYPEFGEMLHEGWTLKKQLSSKISSGDIDDMYLTARKAGATGGKVAGAGGGGFLLLYCPVAKRDNVRASMRKLREMPFQFHNDGSKVIFNYRN